MQHNDELLFGAARKSFTSVLFSMLGLFGLASGCAAETIDTGDGAGGVAVSAIMGHGDGSDEDPEAVLLTLLSGHRRCPSLGYYSGGDAYDTDRRSVGRAILVDVREGRAANGNGGGNALTEDAFFDNVPEGPFTICARPARSDGWCREDCNTARAFGNAYENRKTHVDLIMTCETDGTQDVGAVAFIQHEPQIDVTSAIETGLVACGSSTSADILSVGGVVNSPDGTDAEYRLDFVGVVPAGITMNPTIGVWHDATGGFMASLANSSGLPASVTVRISARTPSLDGGYLFAESYELTFEWLECL